MRAKDLRFALSPVRPFARSPLLFFALSPFHPFTLSPLPLLLAAPLSAQQQPAKRPLKVDDFARVRSVGDPQLSPDGQWVAYTVSSADLGKDTNDTDVWMASWDGTTNLRLTSTPESESSPRWSP